MNVEHEETILSNSVPKQIQDESTSAIEKRDRGQDEVVVGKLNLEEVMIPVEKKSKGEEETSCREIFVPTEVKDKDVMVDVKQDEELKKTAQLVQ